MSAFLNNIKKRLDSASRGDRMYERPMTWDEADTLIAMTERAMGQLSSPSYQTVGRELTYAMFLEGTKALEDHVNLPSGFDAKACMKDIWNAFLQVAPGYGATDLKPEDANSNQAKGE